MTEDDIRRIVREEIARIANDEANRAEPARLRALAELSSGFEPRSFPPGYPRSSSHVIREVRGLPPGGYSKP